MKERILELRAEGKTFNAIKSILGCSKSTILMEIAQIALKII